MSTDDLTGAIQTDDPCLNLFPLYAQMRATSPVFFHLEQEVLPCAASCPCPCSRLCCLV